MEEDEESGAGQCYDKLECVYHKVPGWRSSTQGITKFDITQVAGNIWLSWRKKLGRDWYGLTGSGSDHTILMDEFVKELQTASSRKV